MQKNKFTVQIVENREVALNTYLMKMNLLGKKINPKPGQFLVFNLDTVVLLNRPFSIHYFYDDKKHIKILYRVKGKGTEFLSRKAVGDYIDFYGPFGTGFSMPKNLKRVAVVAGGIGYAPFAFLIHDILKKNRKINIDVFYGACSEKEFVEFWRMEDPRLNFMLSTDNGSRGFKGFVTDLFRETLDSGEKFDLVYTCGPLSMMKKIAELCSGKKIKSEGSIEKRFGCGFGVCLGCSVKLKSGSIAKVCKDGPVFNLNLIDWSYLDED